MNKEDQHHDNTAPLTEAQKQESEAFLRAIIVKIVVVSAIMIGGAVVVFLYKGII